jgi:hypothetical protein
MLNILPSAVGKKMSALISERRGCGLPVCPSRRSRLRKMPGLNKSKSTARCIIYTFTSQVECVASVFLGCVKTVESLHNFLSVLRNVLSLIESSVKLFIVSMTTVFNASGAEIGAVDDDDDDQGPDSDDLKISEK